MLPNDDIDTDQIIPARFLTTTDEGEASARICSPTGATPKTASERPEFALNRPENRGAAVLVAGNNFGCGSSREHAPWASLDYGIRVVVSTEIAVSFAATRSRTGSCPSSSIRRSHRWLLADPGAEVFVDLATATLEMNGKRVTFPIDRFSRYCLMNGIDQLGFLLEQDASISRYEQTARMTKQIVVLAGDGSRP